MKYLYIIISIFLLLGLSCHDDDYEEFKKNCPYELQYRGHWLRIPVTISPHQMQYRVGDTMLISTMFSDSIYDLGTQQTFKIEGFPFKPSTLLYHVVESESHNSGYSMNRLKVDSIYSPYFWNSSRYADGFRSETLYIDGMYHFQCELILDQVGRYVLVFTDQYENHIGSGNSHLNAEADAIRFEGQCVDDEGKPTLGYSLCSMIDSGDDHLDKFVNELIYLDDEVYRGNLRNNKGTAANDPLYPGGASIQFHGYFGFEVVE